MSRPTHAPGWRGKPQSYASLAGANDESESLIRWLLAASGSITFGVIVAGFATIGVRFVTVLLP